MAGEAVELIIVEPWMHKVTYTYLFFIFFSGCLFLFPDTSFPSNSNNIAVVVSTRIRPYLEVLEGINDSINKDFNKISPFFLSSKTDNQKIIPQLTNEPYALYVAIGPEAAKLIWGLDGGNELPKMYTAVLNPGNIIKKMDKACGISLQIPVEIQVQEISGTFPELKNIGLIFDAAFNEWFYKEASIAAKENGLTIVPLYVDSKIEIPKVIKNNWNRIDCLWMIPDKTIISEKIIQYIVKQGLYHKKGVIGYNPFFIRSGAFFSFEFDYRKLGGQTAGKIELYLKKGECRKEPPVFHKTVNEKMTDKIGIKVRE